VIEERSFENRCRPSSCRENKKKATVEKETRNFALPQYSYCAPLTPQISIISRNPSPSLDDIFKLRVLGDEHPNTLTSMANLASTYRNQGRWKEPEPEPEELFLRSDGDEKEGA
jgi:hypothetical protein